MHSAPRALPPVPPPALQGSPQNSPPESSSAPQLRFALRLQDPVLPVSWRCQKMQRSPEQKPRTAPRKVNFVCVVCACCEITANRCRCVSVPAIVKGTRRDLQWLRRMTSPLPTPITSNVINWNRIHAKGSRHPRWHLDAACCHQLLPRRRNSTHTLRTHTHQQATHTHPLLEHVK